uniref:ATP synthase subunit 8 n=1 Tax=Oribatula sp. XFX TaxID=2652662 RepID=A0A5J6VCN1_9ACAR|nr:ATP synthase subunit 8 [Oribatula sp. XFX]
MPQISPIMWTLIVMALTFILLMNSSTFQNLSKPTKKETKQNTKKATIKW